MITNARLNYNDEDRIKIAFSVLVFRVDAINEKWGTLSQFGDAFDLWGTTNGKLYILSDMHMPGWELFELLDTKLKSLGFESDLDYVYLEEQMIYGVNYSITPLLHKPIPGSEKAPWLDSVIKMDGNFVWMKEPLKGQGNTSGYTPFKST